MYSVAHILLDWMLDLPCGTDAVDKKLVSQNFCSV